MHSHTIRGCISECAFGAVGLLRLLRSSSRRRIGLLACLSHSRVDSRLLRRRASRALLVVTTAMTRCILAISRLHLTNAPSTVDPLRLLRSSSRRRGGSLARLSRSRVGSRLPRRRASLALLVVAMAKIRCILASFAVASRRVPLAPSIFACVARYHDGVPYRSRVTRARESVARASRAVGLPSR